MLFKNSVRTSKRTPHFTITKINWLTLFKFNENEKDRRILQTQCKNSCHNAVTIYQGENSLLLVWVVVVVDVLF
jgi:hypothetical protein